MVSTSKYAIQFIMLYNEQKLINSEIKCITNYLIFTQMQIINMQRFQVKKWSSLSLYIVKDIQFTMTALETQRTIIK